MKESAAQRLARFVDHSCQNQLPPILWVGAGASAAAGYPTLAAVEKHLRESLPGSAASGFALIEEYVTEYSRASLGLALERLLGTARKPGELHESSPGWRATTAFAPSTRPITTSSWKMR